MREGRRGGTAGGGGMDGRRTEKNTKPETGKNKREGRKYEKKPGGSEKINKIYDIYERRETGKGYKELIMQISEGQPVASIKEARLIIISATKNTGLVFHA